MVSWRFDGSYKEILINIPGKDDSKDKKKDKKKKDDKKRIDEVGGEQPTE